MVVTGCLFELGEILARSGVKIHMSDVWNALDCVSNSLVLSWFICRMYPSQVTPLSLHPYIPLSKESLTQLVNPLTQHFKTLQLTHFCTRLYEHKLVQCIYEHHASSFFNPLTHFCTRLYEHHSLFFFLLHSTTSTEGSSVGDHHFRHVSRPGGVFVRVPDEYSGLWHSVSFVVSGSRRISRARIHVPHPLQRCVR